MFVVKRKAEAGYIQHNVAGNYYYWTAKSGTANSNEKRTINKTKNVSSS